MKSMSPRNQEILNQILNPYQGKDFWSNKLQEESESLLESKDQLSQQ